MKKKGFTLIELLAVIVILGIISLIAIPTVTNIIKESKKGAFKSSVQNIISAVETQCQLEQISGRNITSLYTLIDGKLDSNINIKGSLPTSGTISVDSSCNVFLELNENDFCAIKDDNTNELRVGEIINGSCNVKIICKRATTLHIEECKQTSIEKYCSGINGHANKTISYGNLGTNGTLSSGDAFDCDVNDDGIYDSITERFYYVSDYYNTSKLNFEIDKAVLIYYSNTYYGEPSISNVNIEYNKVDMNSKDEYVGRKGPVTGATYLPTKGQWNNVSLISAKRQILDELGNKTSETHKLSMYDYMDYAARFLTTQELEMGCNITVGDYTVGELKNCEYLLENSKYSSSEIETSGYWLENIYSSTSKTAWQVHVSKSNASLDEVADLPYFGVRPVIELYKTQIKY